MGFQTLCRRQYGIGCGLASIGKSASQLRETSPFINLMGTS